MSPPAYITRPLCPVSYLTSRARTFSTGCFDAFTVFAFLAFLLALLDLILELQGDARKKRSIDSSPNFQNENLEYKWMERNATLAAHSIFRGFLNTLDSADNSCAQLYFCEGAQAASKQGSVGKKIARIAR